MGSKGEAVVTRVVAFRVRKIQVVLWKAGDDQSGGSSLSDNDVAASGARGMPNHQLRDHDSDKKLNVEGAFGGCCSCGEQGWSVALCREGSRY